MGNAESQIWQSDEDAGDVYGQLLSESTDADLRGLEVVEGSSVLLTDLSSKQRVQGNARKTVARKAGAPEQKGDTTPQELIWEQQFISQDPSRLSQRTLSSQKPTQSYSFVPRVPSMWDLKSFSTAYPPQIPSEKVDPARRVDEPVEVYQAGNVPSGKGAPPDRWGLPSRLYRAEKTTPSFLHRGTYRLNAKDISSLGEKEPTRRSSPDAGLEVSILSHIDNSLHKVLTYDRFYGDVSAYVVVNWKFLRYMSSQFDGEMTDVEHVITLTGSVRRAQATTCGAYVREMWPVSGPFFLSLLQLAYDDRGELYKPFGPTTQHLTRKLTKFIIRHSRPAQLLSTVIILAFAL
jgi:hypothetical protein